MTWTNRTIIVVALLATWVEATSAAGPTTRGTSTAERMRQDAGQLMFRLVYVGPEDKGYYSEAWGPPPSRMEMLAIPRARITAAQARRAADWMGRDGLLDERVAEDIGTPIKSADGPRYLLMVSGPHEGCRVDLGWGPGMLRRIEGMRDALGDGAGEGMKRLLARLAGERERWATEDKGEKKAQG